MTRVPAAIICYFSAHEKPSMSSMLIQIVLLLTYLSVQFALQINFYSSVGQIKQEISVKNGYFQTYFSNDEYNAIVPGTIDFPGQKILEQDFYNSAEQLRNTNIYLRSNRKQPSSILLKLIDPYRFLIKTESHRYMYLSQDQIEFSKDPLINGKILSVRLSNPSITRANMTYLLRGLQWTPRYEIIIINERSATLRAIADLSNTHERTYHITSSRLITGDVPLSTTLVSAQYQPIHAYAAPPIATQPQTSNFGTYSYNITRHFDLLPKSVKSYPFLTPKLTLDYTLETSTYISTGVHAGLFQRVFILQANEFLPAGPVTFYLQKTGVCLGQSRLSDTPKSMEQRVQIDTDPDVTYKIHKTTTNSHSSASRTQEWNLSISLSNRKEKQAVSVTLKLLSGYADVKFKLQKSSSNVKVFEDSDNRSTVVIRATIKASSEETCTIFLQQKAY